MELLQSSFSVPNTPYYLASLIYIFPENTEGRNLELRSRTQRKTSFRHPSDLDVNSKLV